MISIASVHASTLEERTHTEVEIYFPHYFRVILTFFLALRGHMQNTTDQISNTTSVSQNQT